jgi:divalent metal cation (Fe/Co/Zn/Cd) transporter
VESHAHPTYANPTSANPASAHTVHLDAQAPSAERDRLVRRARWLAAGGLAWHGIEAAVAIGAGIVAGSIALIGFGADSVIEMIAGVVVLWRFAESRDGSASAERRAQQLIAGSFGVLAVYVGFEAVRALAVADAPEVSWIGIGLAIVSLVTMPLLARAKTSVSMRIHSSAGVAEARQTTLCFYMAVALLAGLGANALFGWWWADPIAGLAIAAIAADEARKAWRGEQCCDAC